MYCVFIFEPWLVNEDNSLMESSSVWERHCSMKFPWFFLVMNERHFWKLASQQSSLFQSVLKVNPSVRLLSLEYSWFQPNSAITKTISKLQNIVIINKTKVLFRQTLVTLVLFRQTLVTLVLFRQTLVTLVLFRQTLVTLADFGYHV